jgi:hypothetical protein
MITSIRAVTASQGRRRVLTGQAVSRRFRTTAGLALGAALLVGCASTPAPSTEAPVQAAGPSPTTAHPSPTTAHPSPTTTSRTPAAADLSFHYHAKGAQEYIDQTLLVVNEGPDSVVPTLAITPLDSAGNALSGVSVSTAFGSDHGMLVVAPGEAGSYDILAFSGPDKAKVAAVNVVVTKVLRATAPAGAEGVTVQAADQDGKSISKFDRFQQVVLKNPNAAAVSARAVYIVYDQPADGASQQAVAVVPIGDLTVIPGNGTVTLPVTGAAQDAVAKYSGRAAVSLKAYFSQ